MCSLYRVNDMLYLPSLSNARSAVFVSAEAVDQGAKSTACDPSVGHETTADTGYLAGLTVTESAVGTSECPWVVQAPRGRRVNLTLFNFAGAITTSAHEFTLKSDLVGPGCPVGTGLVVFDGNRTTAIPLCNNDGARQKRVYTSEGPVLRLFIQTFTDVAPQSLSKNSVAALQTNTLSATSFLIKYQGSTIIYFNLFLLFFCVFYFLYCSATHLCY